MRLHRNAKLGLAGRLALVRAIEQGSSLKAAAAAFSDSSATACRWHRRWLEATAEERRREPASVLLSPPQGRRALSTRIGRVRH